MQKYIHIKHINKHYYQKSIEYNDISLIETIKITKLKSQQILIQTLKFSKMNMGNTFIMFKL